MIVPINSPDCSSPLSGVSGHRMSVRDLRLHWRRGLAFRVSVLSEYIHEQ